MFTSTWCFVLLCFWTFFSFFCCLTLIYSLSCYSGLNPRNARIPFWGVSSGTEFLTKKKYLMNLVYICTSIYSFKLYHILVLTILRQNYCLFFTFFSNLSWPLGVLVYHFRRFLIRYEGNLIYGFAEIVIPKPNCY